MPQEFCKSIVLATLQRAALSQSEISTAHIVKTGIRESEIAMLVGPPMLLGQLQAYERVLTGHTSTLEDRDAAAQVLIRSSHRPHRIIAAQHMQGRPDLPIWAAA